MKIKYNLYRRAGLLSGTLYALLFLLILGNTGVAQMVVTNGTRVTVVSGSYLSSSEDLVINSGGTVSAAGTLVLRKNLINSNPSENSLGTGTVQFAGTTGQSVSGLNRFQNLLLLNSAGLTLSGNTRVNGILTLTSGRISLGTNNLLLGPSATVAGTLSSSNMIVTNSTGQLRKEFSSAGTFLFPIGDVTGSAEYTPVTLTFSSGTFGSGNYAGVSVVDNQYPGTAISYLTRYWNVASSGITGFSAGATFKYLAADVVGIEADIFCAKVNTSPFVTYNAANVGAKTVDAQGLSSFGSFTGNLGNAGPPPIRSLQNKTIGSGTVTCADAAQTLLIAGNGTTYVVENGGSVTHIAGTNIIYYPGTRVHPGGYLHGYISSTFCAPYIHPAPPAVMAGTGSSENGIMSKNTQFKVYPNPTPGRFTVELQGDESPANVKVEIFGSLGEKIQSTPSMQSNREEFTLEGRPAGMYMVHLISPSGTETRKIIKQ